MIDQIINSLKGELTSKLVSDYNIEDKNVDQAVDVAQKSIMETVQGEVSRGNISGLLSMLQDKDQVAANPIVTHMIRKYAGDLGAKLGLEPSVAASIANFAIPFIISKFQEVVQEKGLDLGSLMTMFGGGNSGSNDLDDKLKNQFGDSLGGFFK